MVFVPLPLSKTSFLFNPGQSRHESYLCQALG